MVRSISAVVFGIAVIGSIAFYYTYQSGTPTVAAAAASDTKTVRWLIGHQPTALFDRSNAAFAEELSAATGGKLKLEILTPEDVGISERDLTREEVYAFMKEGKADISSLYVGSFVDVSTTASIFAVPYLFSDYEHVESFVESEQGKKVLADISEKSPVTALAFTFSGGFRSIASRSETLTSVASVNKKSIAFFGGAVTESNLLGFGAKPVSTSEENVTPDTVLVTYTRIGSADQTSLRSILETAHEVFATMIVADDAFVASLSPSEQQALTAAAEKAARMERQDSISFANETRRKLIEAGVVITPLSAQERASAEKALGASLEKAEQLLGKDFIAEVRALDR